MFSHTNPIPDKTTNDTIVAEAAQTPTVIYVCNSSLPVCKTFTPQYESLALRMRDQSRTNCSKRNIRFCTMEFSTETAPMFKFSPNQLPVITLICHDREGKYWARTMMSPTLAELEAKVEEMREKAGAGEIGVAM